MMQFNGLNMYLAKYDIFHYQLNIIYCSRIFKFFFLSNSFFVVRYDILSIAKHNVSSSACTFLTALKAPLIISSDADVEKI